MSGRTWILLTISTASSTRRSIQRKAWKRSRNNDDPALPSDTEAGAETETAMVAHVETTEPHPDSLEGQDLLFEKLWRLGIPIPDYPEVGPNYSFPVLPWSPPSRRKQMGLHSWAWLKGNKGFALESRRYRRW